MTDHSDGISSRVQTGSKNGVCLDVSVRTGEAGATRLNVNIGGTII